MQNSESPDLSQLINPAVQLSVEAGNATMEYYQGNYTIQIKGDGTKVTAADHAAHEIIDTGINRLTPKIPVVSEENSNIPNFRERQHWDFFWLVDPIDGTNSFIRGHGDFTINIALIGHGEPILGVVHNPIRNCTHWGAKGQGACRIDEKTGESASIAVHRFAGKEARVIASISRKRKPLEKFMDALTVNSVESDLSMVFSSFKFCLMAEGVADVYPGFGRTSEWDTAAGQCVLESAGGSVLDLSSRQSLSYNKPSLENPWFLAMGGGAFPWIDYVEKEIC